MAIIIVYVVTILLTATSNAFESPPQTVYDPKLQKCVSGFCLPLDYKRLEAPFKDSYTTVKVETDIMDVLQVYVVRCKAMTAA
jgi:hypothetical protein